MAALLQLLEQVAQPTADNAAGSAACEQSAKPALEKVAESATKSPTNSTTSRTADVAARCGCLRRICTGGAAAQMLDRLVGKQRQDRHGERRHSAAGLRARARGPARTLLHSVEYIE